jgi:hypothetical protein
MEIVKTYSAFTLKPSNKFTLNSEQNIIYIHIASRQILYTFDTANM